MAVRSVTEIWIDANFKETQLADLNIGQPVLCEVDMYGNRHEFEGRITGFTMGTGQPSPPCRRRTPPAISSKLSSGCRCALS